MQNECGSGAAPIANQTMTPLESITDRILRYARDAQEIGHKLNNHADALHGPVPEGKEHLTKAQADRPMAAMHRIFQALDELEGSIGYLAEAAGRNTTLA